MNPGLAIVLILVALAGGVFLGYMLFFKKGVAAGVEQRKRDAEAIVGSAEQQAERIVEDAEKDADNKKKSALIEAKDEIHKLRTEADKEIKDRRAELSRQERRMQQKEENLDKKTDNLEKKEETLNQKIKSADEKLKEAETIKKSQLDVLERISEFTKDQAKEYIISKLEDDLVHEKAVKIAAYDQQIKDECQEKARSYISLAIAKVAADQVSEAAVSVVTLLFGNVPSCVLIALPPYKVTPFLNIASSCLSKASDFAWTRPDATSRIYWKRRSAAASRDSPSAMVPALKSIQFRLNPARWLLLEILIVGTGQANGVPRPVVNSTIWAPAAAKALEATKSFPGACSRLRPFFVALSP